MKTAADRANSPRQVVLVSLRTNPVLHRVQSARTVDDGAPVHLAQLANARVEQTEKINIILFQKQLTDEL